MPEPHATATGAGLALGTITLTGTIFGMHYDALVIGFLASLVTLLRMPPDGAERTPARVFYLVSGASFMAGVFAPSVALAAENYFPWIERLGKDGMRITAAALIGVGVHVAIPLAFAWIGRRVRGEP